MSTSSNNKGFTNALVVALGGFLMGFDASVISGVVSFIEEDFQLDKIQVGWAVASLTLTASLAMLAAGPLSQRFGRVQVLKFAAALFAISAILSAFAPSYFWLVAARMLGGFGVGAALIIAPMYIAESSPAELRGRRVSLNQLNIVIGISAAFFSNYLILLLAQSDVASINLENAWRWMLGIEAVPALLYLFGLFSVPESPRWLMLKGQPEKAEEVLAQLIGQDKARAEITSIAVDLARPNSIAPIKELWQKPMRLALLLGLTIAITQQITGINAVFFYAPMIFEQSGIGTNASFVQAILVGLVNLVFTLLAIAFIDKIGRKPLLVFGLSGITFFMMLLAYQFSNATYVLNAVDLQGLDAPIVAQLQSLQAQVFNSDIAFKEALSSSLGLPDALRLEAQLLTAAISINATWVLIGILGFVACFAISIGPVMWVLFSELFPNRIRAIAVSCVGLVNSAVSFLVQLVFPWELANFGSATTFAIYGGFSLIGLLILVRYLPETKGQSLESIEALLHTPATKA
ncbi:sugar porter family MFS transporter [Glaciecola sp. SC05]|uniref:sugar porter family MFS transporter n=1 Tax=Glaciecola sp. SC05 TaxID=1987355 RepID=UPI003529578E